MRKLLIVILCIMMMSLLVACNASDGDFEIKEVSLAPIEAETQDQDSDYGVDQLITDTAEIVHSERVFDLMFREGLLIAGFPDEFDGEIFGELHLLGSDGTAEAFLTNGFTGPEGHREDAGEARLSISDYYIMFEHSMGEIFPAENGTIYYYVAKRNDDYIEAHEWTVFHGWTIFLYKEQAAYESGADPVGELQVGIWG